MSSGTSDDMDWLPSGLEARLDIKTKQVGHGKKVAHEGEILNRVVRATPSGFEFEADPRRAELVVEPMNSQGARGAATEGIDDLEDDEEPLQGTRVAAYRSRVARANDLAVDRPDIVFASKELCRRMSKPTKQS